VSEPIVCIHTPETDSVILKHKGNISAACTELEWGNNRAVRKRAVELGIITEERRSGHPPIKYVPTPEVDALILKHREIKRVAKEANWDKAAVRRRGVELGVFPKRGKVKRHRVYKPTKKIDAIIRQFKGHVQTIKTVLSDWSDYAILNRAIELGVRQKHEHVPKDLRYHIVDPAVDEAIRRNQGYVIAIKKETEWGKEAIRRRCLQLGIVPKGVNPTAPTVSYQKMYIPTADVDAIITRCWTEKYRGAGCIVRAVEEIKALGGLRWSEQAVFSRARELGLTKPRGRASTPIHWSDEENSVVLTHAHRSVQTIQLKLKDRFPDKPRSLSAITAQMSRLSARSSLDGYSQKALTIQLHVNNYTVLRWTARGLLKGVKREMERTDEQGGGYWHFTTKDVREFMLAHPEEIDITAVNKVWLFDILSGGKILSEKTDAEIKKRKRLFSDEVKVPEFSDRLSIGEVKMYLA
jgi:hypothetical protein